MFKKLVKTIVNERTEERRTQLYRNLMRREAEIGGQLFGSVAKGVRRDFFCLDEYTWVWHEEWTDQAGKRHTKTTRYDIRPSGIVKSQDGNYMAVSEVEARRLRDAVILYEQRISKELYAAVA